MTTAEFCDDMRIPDDRGLLRLTASFSGASSWAMLQSRSSTLPGAVWWTLQPSPDRCPRTSATAHEPPSGFRSSTFDTRDAPERASPPRWWLCLVNSGEAETGPARKGTGRVSRVSCRLRRAPGTTSLSR
jgi:hypothetical protein